MLLCKIKYATCLSALTDSFQHKKFMRGVIYP